MRNSECGIRNLVTEPTGADARYTISIPHSEFIIPNSSAVLDTAEEKGTAFFMQFPECV